MDYIANKRWVDDELGKHQDIHLLELFMRNMVDNPYLVTFLKLTPLFDWYVIRRGSKIGYQKDVCLKEIELHPRIITTIMDIY